MSNTEQVQTSKEKQIIEKIGFKEFSVICEEFQIVEKSVQRLLSLADDINTEPKEKISIYKWLVEMNIGKPVQRKEIGQEQKPEVITIISRYEECPTLEE